MKNPSNRELNRRRKQSQDELARKGRRIVTEGIQQVEQDQEPSPAPPQQQVSVTEIFAKIGSQLLEIDLLRAKNERLAQELQMMRDVIERISSRPEAPAPEGFKVNEAGLTVPDNAELVVPEGVA